MSDFDKEAEREKLREKFEQEEDSRGATEQMSELLLKGATMTNAHCTDCGDPIFRHDGQEFCPTCQKPVTRDPAEGEDHIEVTDPSDDAHVQFGDDAGADQSQAEAGAADQQSQPTQSQQEATAGASEQSQSPPADQQTPTGQSPATSGEIPSADPERTASRDRQVGSAADGSQPANHAETPDPSGSVAENLSAAESMLAETVTRFAEKARDTDDPRVARDHLAAAREAAEALDAVRY